MKTLLAAVSLLVLFLTVPAMAKKHKEPGAPPATPAPEYRIVEVSAVSITVTVGHSGEEHISYKITDSTKVTLNGAPVAARDLRAGMVARISIAPDRTTATAIDAKDAPAHPDKRRVG